MTEIPIIRRPGAKIEQAGYPGFNPRIERADGMVIERDVSVSLRDGVIIYVDIFRPEHGVDLPAIIGWGPYGKHGGIKYDVFYKNADITPDLVSPYCIFEAPDPAFWCPAGYAIAYVDPRGAWQSGGDANFFGAPKEGEDTYDVIEWLAARPWCNGKIGMSGVSYFTHSQWTVAAQRPPHLAAINPFEGFRDPYREVTYHGGMPDHFNKFWQTLSWWSRNQVEDIVAMMDAHPLFDEYWASKVADISKVDIPTYIVASWSDHGLHTRGTISAFNELASKDKWLEVHGRKKWWYYYQPESLRRQRAFFDRFLRGIDRGAMKDWPRVRLEVRENYYVGVVRNEKEWPLARCTPTALYLDATARNLSLTPLLRDESASYGADPDFSSASYHDDRVEFDIVFDKDVELTGEMKLKLWVEAQGADDLDLFVALQKFDVTGRYVGFPFFSVVEDGPVALGWLRASHRALDPERSTALRPWHTHDHEERLAPGAIVPIEIEIWPSSTVFRSGEKLRLVIRGQDIYRYRDGTFAGNHPTRNRGRHVIHAGGKYDSHLLVPLIKAGG
jgi:hypothetical protein